MRATSSPRVFFVTFCVLLIRGVACCHVRHDAADAATAARVPWIARYFGTKGRYEEVNPHLLLDPDAVVFVAPPTLAAPPPQCRAVHLNAVVRHGTREPTAKNAKKMRTLYDLVSSSSSAPAGRHGSWLVRDIRQRFHMWYTEDMDGRLVDKGAWDLRHLAVRLAKRFPSVLSEESLRGGRVSFTTSSKHRCINSTLAFKGGLARLWAVEEEVAHQVNDSLMRFFDSCPRFVEEVNNNPAALVELDRFNAGPEMQRVTQKLADRLGLPYNLITADLAVAGFYLCAYEFAIKTITSPWCKLFDEADAQVMEYANDLKQYWKRGYGHPINRWSSCILLQDLFLRLDKAAAEAKSGGPVSEAVSIQVGHADTLLPLLTLLGFFRDQEPLTAGNFAAQADRAFRTSRTMPYAANLLLVLYDCGEADGPRVQALLNEAPLAFPGVDPGTVPPGLTAPLYRDVRSHYEPLLLTCGSGQKCRLAAHSEMLQSISL